MITDTIPPLTLTGFEAAPAWAGGAFDLVLRGSADMTASQALKSYLKEVDGEARRLGVDVVHVRLGELYFLSSSCFQALATWLSSVAARRDGRYRVSFETHPGHAWQRRSLEAIRRMAPDVIVVV